MYGRGMPRPGKPNRPAYGRDMSRPNDKNNINQMKLKSRKYHRANWHDYNGGIYFVTVTTDANKHHFGSIKNNIMCLSELGGKLDNFIASAPEHYPQCEIWNHIVMPNHWHAIIFIDRAKTMPCRVAACRGPENMGAIHAPVHEMTDVAFAERHHFNSLLSQVVGSIKSATTRYSNRHGFKFKWHDDFYDNIIKSQHQYDMIFEYICDNPARWDKDRFNT